MNSYESWKHFTFFKLRTTLKKKINGPQKSMHELYIYGNFQSEVRAEFQKLYFNLLMLP